MSAVPWRGADVRYANNEIYFDIIEDLDQALTLVTGGKMARYSAMLTEASQSAEARIGERLERLLAGRAVPAKRKSVAHESPNGNPMSTGSEAMKRRRTKLSEIAAEERRDATTE